MVESGWNDTEGDENIIREKVRDISHNVNSDVSYNDIPYARKELFEKLFKNKHTTQ